MITLFLSWKFVLKYTLLYDIKSGGKGHCPIIPEHKHISLCNFFNVIVTGLIPLLC